jgi:hypothetical protein
MTATAATVANRAALTGLGHHHGGEISAGWSVVSPTVQAASSGLTRSAATTDTDAAIHVIAMDRRSGGGWEPAAAAQDLGGPGWEVFFDFGVVVGHDPFHVGVGLCGVAQGFAGRDQVEQDGVGDAASGERDLCGGRGEGWFTAARWWVARRCATSAMAAGCPL